MKTIIVFNVLIVTILIVRRIVNGKISKRLQYAMWSLLPIYLIISTFFSVSIPVKVSYKTAQALHYTASPYKVDRAEGPSSYNVDPEIVVPEKNVQVPVTTIKQEVPGVTTETDENVVTAVHEEKPLDTTKVLGVLYFAGVFTIGTVVIRNNICFWVQIRRQRKFYELFFNNLKVYKLDYIKSPFLFGRGVYIPSRMNTDDVSYEYALYHEYSHYKQGAGIASVVEFLLLIMFWFDPLIWVAYSVVQKDCEYAADEAVIKKFGRENGKKYSQTLLNMLTTKSNYSGVLTAATFMNGKSKSFLRTRVTNIMSDNRKSIAATIAVSIFMAIIVSCSAIDSTTNEVAYVQDDTTWYNFIKIEMDFEKYGANVISPKIFLYEDDYFVCHDIGRIDDEDMWYPVDYLTKYSYDGKVLSSINILDYIEDDYSEYINRCLGYSIGGKDYVVLQLQDLESYKQVPVIYEIDYDNNQLKNSHIFNLEGYLGVDYELVDINVSGSYVVYTAQNNKNYDVCQIVINSINGDEYITHFDRGGNTYFVPWKTNYESNWGSNIYYQIQRSNNAKYYLFNPETGEISESNFASNTEIFDVLTMPDGTFLRMDSGVITKTNINTGEEEELTDINNSAISPCYIKSGVLCAYTDKHIVITCDYYDDFSETQSAYIYVLTKADKNPNTGKQIVTVGYFDILPDELGMVIEKNNSSDSKYFIMTTNKYSWGEYFDPPQDESKWNESCHEAQQTAQHLFEQDVAGGTAPDVLINFSNYCAFTSDVVYADLTPYIDGDNGLNRKDFVDFIFNPSSDGKIYQLAYGFSVNGIVASEDIGNMTYEEYIDFVNKHHAGNDVIMSREAAFDFPVTDIDYFLRLWDIECSSYIQDGHINITSGENAERFYALAEFVKDRHNNYHADDKNGGKVIEATEDGVSDFYCYIAESRGAIRSVVGYPSLKGNKPSSNISSIAISSCCSDKNAAWSVAKMMFDYDIQIRLSHTAPVSIPVNRKALNDDCDNAIERIESGSYNADYCNWNMKIDDYSIWKDGYLEAVNSVGTAIVGDYTVDKIICEELPSYFMGQKSIEDVAVIIENRVNLYLDEIR